MPLGWERINARTSSPNKNIVFIKPLARGAGADEATAKDFLERIAAQCLPVMNEHALGVVSLEEFPPNMEFWGRNFNNGEVIQLVLRSPTTGRWLPFRFVQMVMMHELAHCKQMNHSAAFWKLRNSYAAQMHALWERGYTGDGLWGRGSLLANGQLAHAQLDADEVLPEHMCGGTFQSRGRRKRALRPKITYKEQKERRIRKKFGVNGVALGADEAARTKLEHGRKVPGKPKVAASKRGRDLRAAAALARFEVTKPEPPSIKDEELVTDSEPESEDDPFVLKTEPDDALDFDGQPLLDTHGGHMVKVCDDDARDSAAARDEMSELMNMRPAGRQQATRTSPQPGPSTRSPPKSVDPVIIKPEPQPDRKKKTPTQAIINPASTNQPPPSAACPICSVADNPPASLVCLVCGHVLRPDADPAAWSCASSACARTAYLNSGDTRVCGVCGERRGV